VVTGAARLANFLRAISGWYWDGVEVRWATLNGQAAAVLVRDGEVTGALTVIGSADGIDQILWMVNPDKLTAI
jgi:DNA-binding IclR family transcriptional regulator